MGFPPKDSRKVEMQQLLQSLAAGTELIEALISVRNCPQPSYTQQQMDVLRASFLLLRQALAELLLLFARTQQTDFTQVLLSAQRALQQDTNGIALALGTRIQHLLVDEMQDTSISQFLLLEALTAGWDGSSQTVFLVGDPKQSIYRFRNAEVALFGCAQRNGLGGIPLETLSLTRNFRSQPTLVENANHWFEEIFRSSSQQNAIPFIHSQSVRPDTTDACICWHPHLLSEASQSSTEAAEEASAICDQMEAIQQKARTNGSSKSIAILLRKKSQAPVILHTLRERGIACHAVDMDTLDGRQPLLDLLALARALLHAADRIAWLAVLRAPWCGLSLADLHTLCGAGEEEFRSRTVAELLQQRMALLSADGQQRTQRVWTALQQALALRTQENFSMLVERLWHTLGGPHCIAPEDRPSVDQFLQMLSAMENEPRPSTGNAIEERMQTLFANTPALQENPVEILTIHKAKGLEWDVVFLPGLHVKGHGSDSKLLLWSEEWHTDPQNGPAKPCIYLAPIQHATEDKEPTSTWLRKRLSERDTEELRRLFYVACTRARDQLHLFATAKINKIGELANPKSASLLAIAWPIAESEFTNALAQAQQRQSGTVLPMPATSVTPTPEDALSIAAVQETPSISLSNFHRLPADWQPESKLLDAVQFSAQPSIEAEPLERPQGSLQARAFGTVLHALLQPLAGILRAEPDVSVRSAAIAQLQRPAELRLRQYGIPEQEARASAKKIMQTLTAISADTTALWMLSAQPLLDSALPEFEIPLTVFLKNEMHSVRLDRMFLAGSEPGKDGTSHLWIVDFKTTTHSAHGLENFLAEQNEMYRPTMQRYAAAVRAAYPQAPVIHLALYYPLLLRCVWWAAEPA